MVSDFEFKNVSNMDQFANFLLSQQTVQKTYTSCDEDDNDECD